MSAEGDTSLTSVYIVMGKVELVRRMACPRAKACVDGESSLVAGVGSAPKYSSPSLGVVEAAQGALQEQALPQDGCGGKMRHAAHATIYVVDEAACTRIRLQRYIPV